MTRAKHRAKKKWPNWKLEYLWLRNQYRYFWRPKFLKSKVILNFMKREK